MMKFKGYRYLIILLLTILACESGEEEETFTPDDDTNVNTNVKIEDILGTWFIYSGEFMDTSVQIAPRFPVCGYEYLVFSENSRYEEVLYNNDDCVPVKKTGNWKIENGIISISFSSGEVEELSIIDFKSSELVIKFQFDFDDDGNKDVFKANLKRYDPISNNHVATSFARDSDEPSLLKFNWKQETDVNTFTGYEVYRSIEGSCAKENAVLLTEINDITNTTFIDYDPPATTNTLCYFLRIYSDDVMVGESRLLTENPKDLIIPNTPNLNSVSVDGETILLEWSEYDIPYFSHYEIVYASTDGTNLLFHEEDSVKTINAIEETSFLDTDPPYIENPFYAVYAYNIFGTNVVSNYEQVTFRQKDLFGPIYLSHLEVDDDEPAVYLHGSSQIPSWASYDTNAILRLNYDQGVLESTTSEEVYVAGEFPFRKPFNFSEGKELVVNGRNNLHFLNPTSLSEIFSFGSFYLFEEFNVSSIVDFTYTKNGFLVVIDTDSIFIFQRNGEELMLLDKQIHFETHHGDNLYRIIHVNDDEIIVGHKNDQESILYAVDDNGILQNRRVITLPLSSDYIAKYKNTSFYSDSGNLLINYGQRKLYSTISFQVEAQLPEDLFALGLSKDAKYIFASTIDPDWFGSDVKTEFLKREVLLFNTDTNEIQTIKIKGYPIRIFENNLGEIFSVSIPKNQIITDFDVFVEKINFF